MTARDAALGDARTSSASYFARIVNERTDTSGWEWTDEGMTFLAGLIITLAGDRCAHLDGVVPSPAFGSSWSGELRCPDCAVASDLLRVADVAALRCAACGARTEAGLRAWLALRGVYIVGLMLCECCEAMCRVG